MLSESLEILNKRLLDIYGRDFLNRPNFRVVFANSQFEKRKSVFRDFYGSVILLREIEEVREVPKYPYAKDCYILERLSMYDGDEIIKHNGYEPLFVFADKRGNPLDPLWRVIDLIIYTVYHPENKSPSDLSDKEKKEHEKEVQFMLDYMENESPALASALHDRVGITVPSLESTKET